MSAVARAPRPGSRIVGLMTGTSADAVDAILVDFHGAGLEATHEVIAYRETPLPDTLRREVLELAAADRWEPERMMRLDADLGECYAESVRELLSGASVAPGSVDAIGMHGQTLRHLPRSKTSSGALTWQAGSAPILAERTGLRVVSDFRRRDAAAGGEGAPLVPIADWWCFRSDRQSRVLLNLGGMANVTHLPAGGGLDLVRAFDTGPGNAVLDALISLSTAGLARHDDGGRMAMNGRVHEGLLSELLSDPFFMIAPPRSTGREHFGEPYAIHVQRIAEDLGLSIADTLATATELTAASVVDAIERFLRPQGGVDAVYVSGGGVRNACLMLALRRRLDGTPIDRVDVLGVDASSKEALAFALLAHLTLAGEAGNVPGATGARRRVVLGTVTPGAIQDQGD